MTLLDETTTTADAPPAKTAELKRGKGVTGWLPPLVVFAAIIGLWYAITYGLLDQSRRFLMPPPHLVVTEAFLDPVAMERMGVALGRTLQVAFTGLAIAIVIGMAWAVAMSQARWVERSIYPYAVILQTVPILALVPVFGLWFGFGLTSRVLVCILIALFPIIANTLFGLQSVDRDHHDLFTLHGAGRLTRLWKLQFPAALPSIFTGLRISAGLAVIGAIVGDFFFKQGDPGIGILIDLYRARLQSEQMVGAIVLSSLLGVVVFWFFGFLGRRVIGSWHESGGGFGAS
jgi:NitT/TauT family transport system permease protein